MQARKQDSENRTQPPPESQERRIDADRSERIKLRTEVRGGVGGVGGNGTFYP
jgi:hypothetical protein